MRLGFGHHPTEISYQGRHEGEAKYFLTVSLYYEESFMTDPSHAFQ